MLDIGNNLCQFYRHTIVYIAVQFHNCINNSNDIDIIQHFVAK